jgi:hypothetical protein
MAGLVWLVPAMTIVKALYRIVEIAGTSPARTLVPVGVSIS